MEEENDVGRADFSRYSGDECRRCRGGGLFSFIVELGVISDFADRTHTANHILLYEDAVSARGNPWKCLSDLSDWNSRTVRAVGIFRTICRDFCRLLSMALAEILNVFPIFMRRARIVRMQQSLF